MACETRQKRTIRSAIVFEARAGLIPASDDEADERKARLRHALHLISMMRPYTGQSSRVPEDIVITDILADLRCYCAWKNLSFDTLSRASSSVGTE